MKPNPGDTVERAVNGYFEHHCFGNVTVTATDFKRGVSITIGWPSPMPVDTLKALEFAANLQAAILFAMQCESAALEMGVEVTNK